MKTLTVNLPSTKYPIYIGDGVLKEKKLYQSHIKGQQVMLISNKTVAPLYADTVKQQLSHYQVDEVILQDGEQYKTLSTLNHIFDQLLKKKHDRTTTLIALGGGVIGDITGFAAACYQRGVAFIQIPTTLLSQVDSSVGGKTAVNHPLGKNMIGAFYQPSCVIADPTVLNTLPKAEWSAGLAEVIKYGLINDIAFYDWLQKQQASLLTFDSDRLSYIIERSCQNKADLVAKDEKETSVRALLNLGHTFAHAIETHAGYGQWRHGEAVATGLLMAADLSVRLGHIVASDVQALYKLLHALNLPCSPPSSMSSNEFITHMSVDKKVQNGALRLILLKCIGQAYIADDIPAHLLQQTLSTGSTLGH